MLKIDKITKFSIMFKQNFLLKVIKNILSVKNKEDFQPQYIYIFFLKPKVILIFAIILVSGSHHMISVTSVYVLGNKYEV